jgi:hypothetical protein
MFTVATCHIVGTSPLSQSRKHDTPRLKGEEKLHDEYDERTWRHKMTLTDDGKSVAINAFGMQMCIVSGARYLKRKIEGQGNSTWTGKFGAGILLTEPPRLNIDPATVKCLPVSVNADGKRGGGTRVTRRFPVMPQWETVFDVTIMDPMITEEIFREVLDTAGKFIGLGQFRPENWGHNGRFRVAEVAWQDNREVND